MYRLSVVCSNNNQLLLLLLHISIHIIFISFYSDYLLICYCSAFRQRIVIWLLHNDKRKNFYLRFIHNTLLYVFITKSMYVCITITFLYWQVLSVMINAIIVNKIPGYRSKLPQA